MPSGSARASMVVTPGVATSLGGSVSLRRSRASVEPRAISRSAAKSPFSHVTSVFSPEPDGARKSIDSLPPIIPDSAAAEYSSPTRSNIRW